MNILFLTDNFPPETNAAASRVYERACFWVRWGHKVTIVTSAPNFPHGVLFEGYRNRWRQAEVMDGIRVVRVKKFVAANRGVLRRSLDFLSFGVSGFLASLFETRPDVVAATLSAILRRRCGLRRGRAQTTALRVRGRRPVAGLHRRRRCGS